MLTPATRAQFRTLLDARAFNEADDQPAIIYVATDAEPVIISRSALQMAVSGYANALTQLGIHPGDLVLIAHTQNLESIYAFWGALYVGAVPTMFSTLTDKLDPTVYQRDMAKLVSLSQVRAVLTTNKFAPALRAVVDCPVYSSDDLPQANGEVFHNPKLRRSYHQSSHHACFLMT